MLKTLLAGSLPKPRRPAEEEKPAAGWKRAGGDAAAGNQEGHRLV